MTSTTTEPSRTPIWDEEFAARWAALMADEEPAPEPAPAKKPRGKSATRR